MKVVASYSIKGGVGKTATSVNIAYLAAHQGYRTLLCDLDSQGASSFYFRVRPSGKFKLKSLLSQQRRLLKNVKGSDFPYLDVLPANLAYRKFDILLDSMKKSKTRLQKLLGSLDDEYDLVVLDCPPGLSLLSENVFSAADLIVVPVIPTTLSERSLEQLFGFFGEKGLKQKRICPFFSLVEYQKRLHHDTIERLRDAHSSFLEAEIPYSADIERMGIRRKPLHTYAASTRGAKAYEGLWKEVRERLKLDR